VLETNKAFNNKRYNYTDVQKHGSQFQILFLLVQLFLCDVFSSVYFFYILITEIRFAAVWSYYLFATRPLSALKYQGHNAMLIYKASLSLRNA
jgi:hypothetical protein